MASWNVGGLVHKVDDIREAMKEHSISVLFILETWAKAGSRPPFSSTLLWSPEPIMSIRASRASYGIALVLSEDMDPTKVRAIGGIPGRTAWCKIGEVLIGGIYVPPQSPMETYEEYLTPPIPHSGPVIIMGDMNVNLGELVGDHRKISSNGWRFLDLCRTQGLSLVEGSEGQATYLDSNGCQTIIDHIVSNNPAGLVKNVICEDYGTEHRPIYVDVAEPTELQQGNKHRKHVWSLKKFTSEPQINVFVGTLYQELIGIMPREIIETDIFASRPPMDNYPQLDGPINWQELVDHVDIEELHLQISSAIMNAAMKAFSRKPGKDQSGPVGRLIQRDKELKDLRRTRKYAFRHWKNCTNEERKEMLFRQYLDAKKTFSEHLKQKKIDYFGKWCDELCSNGHLDMVKTAATWRKSIKRDIGVKLPCDPQSMDKYSMFFQSQFGEPTTSAQFLDTFGGESRRDCLDQLFRSLQDEGVQPSLVEESLKYLPTGKAPGPSGLRNEFLKIGRAVLKYPLTILFNACLRQGKIPTSWKNVLLHPVFKKGDKLDISNYRPIALSESMRKVFEKTILPRLISGIEPLNVAQGGFRHKRSTLDQAIALHEAIISRKRYLKGQPLVAFLDIKAAYDTVDRNLLWNKVESVLPGNWASIIQDLFEDVQSSVLVNGYQSPTIHHYRGLLQGSSISPLLYALFIDCLPAELCRHSRFKMGDTDIVSFFYADDIALLADDRDHLQSMLETCESHSNRMGYRFAPSKCEVIGLKSGEEVSLYGEPLRKTNNFRYLGFQFGPSGFDGKLHAYSMRDKAITATNILCGMGWTSDNFSLQFKRMAYMSFIRPILEYGIELLQRTELSIVESGQQYALSRLLGVSQTCAAKHMQGLVEALPLSSRTELRRLRYIRRLNRLSFFTPYMVKAAERAHDKKPLKRRSLIGRIKEGSRDLTRRIEAKLPPTEEGGTRTLSVRTHRVGSTIVRKRDEVTDFLWDEWKEEQEGKADGAHLLSKRERSLLDKRPKALRRSCIVWLLRRWIGKPKQCSRCGSNLSHKHLLECGEVGDMNDHVFFSNDADLEAKFVTLQLLCGRGSRGIT